MKIVNSIICLLLFMPTVLKGDLFEIKLIGGLEFFGDEFKMESMNERQEFIGGFGIGKGEKKSRFEANFLIATDFRKMDTYYEEFYYRLYKFSLPLLYKYKFKELDSFYIVAGGSASFILTIRTDINGKPLKEYKDERFLEYGLLFGGGFEKDFRRTSITIEGRYYIGLKELEFWGYTFKRRGFFILLGVLFW